MTVPKLRFKEFDGDWKQETLKNLATFSKGKGISKADISEDGINLCIRYGELYTTYGQVIDHIHSKTNVSKSECILSKAGDVIIPASGETQIDIAIASCVLHDDIILSGDLNILSHEENGSWLAYYLSSAKKLEIAQLAQGNSVVHLYSSQLKDLKINKPSKEEQTKIASFLSAVNDKINQLTQKHQLLSQYKQGMMQKLFSQQIRFKADDGREFGEWEEKTLKDFIVNHVGGASLTPNDFVSESEYEVIPKKAITFNGKLSLDENSPTYCTKSFFEENLKNTVNKDYLITVLRDLVPSGPSIGYIVQFQSSKTYILAQGVYGFQITSNLNKAFLIHFSNTKHYRLVMKSIMVGSTQVHIRNQDFFGIQIPVPCLEEQTKIANFLSAIDQKIEVVAQQIEQAKQWKKGLLQQMFV